MTSAEYKAGREQLGLTQQQLANVTGMTQPAVARIETTRKPTKQQAATMRLLLLVNKHGLMMVM